MTLKNTVAFLLVSLTLFALGCKNTTEKKVVELHNNGNQKKVQILKRNRLVKEFEYYDNGDVMYEGEYKNKNKHGKWTFWFPNGNVWSEGYFKNGKRTGESKVYYENGKTYYTGFYKDGKKDKKWIFYNKMGEPINEVTFKNGEQINSKSKKQ